MNEPLIPGGYILLSRKIIESEIFKKPPLYLKVWIYLLSSAQHSAYKGLERGQLYTSIPEIQEACSYMIGYRKKTPTKDQIYNILEWLRKRCESNCEHDTNTTMITTTKATHGLLVNIDKYSLYQDAKNYESNAEHDNEKVTNTLREQRQPDNINKNVKNVKNDKKLYISIVEYLNQKCNKNFRHSTKSTQRFIDARLNEGFTLDDFKKVIDIKSSQWLGGEMEQYLRPQTLFGTKFESYLNERMKNNGKHGGSNRQDYDPYAGIGFSHEELQEL